jgi:uncharacterized membrane protein YczE
MLNFLSVKEIPTLFWSSPKPLTIRPPVVSVVILLFGISLFSLGEALLVVAGVGVSPWTVFAQGAAHTTGCSIGTATFVASIIVLAAWFPLKQVPGIGTVINAVVVAVALDYSLPYLPTFETFYSKLVQAILGIILIGLGSAIYLIANLGPGPRDGLMTGLQKVTNFPMSVVRNSIELTVVFCGWLLGGTLGVGTVLFALSIGPLISMFMYWLKHIFSKDKN